MATIADVIKAVNNEAAVEKSMDNFVLLDREDMGSVACTLRSKQSPLRHLHVQRRRGEVAGRLFGADGDRVQIVRSFAKTTAKPRLLGSGGVLRRPSLARVGSG